MNVRFAWSWGALAVAAFLVFVSVRAPALGAGAALDVHMSSAPVLPWAPVPAPAPSPPAARLPPFAAVRDLALVRTPEGSVAVAPRLSPDGARLAFATLERPATSVYVAAITDGRVGVPDPVARTRTPPDLAWADAALGISEPFTAEGAFPLWRLPAFTRSPSGQRIVWARRSPHFDVLVRDVLTGRETPVTTARGVHIRPAFTASGIAYYSNVRGAWDLRIADPRGDRVLVPATRFPTTGGVPVSSDGRWVGATDGGEDILLTRADGTQSVRVASGLAENREISLAGRGDRLVVAVTGTPIRDAPTRELVVFSVDERSLARDAR